MDCDYDEDLNENRFFKALVTDYEDAFRRAVLEHWVICVPCSESLENYAINQQNILTHILVPSDELPETHFQTLNGQEVRIFDKLAKIKDFSHNVPILFTESFYRDNSHFSVLCLEKPLNFTSENVKTNLRIYSVKSLRDCIDLLLLESNDGEALIERLDEIIKQFLFLSNKDYFGRTVEQQIALTRSIYNRCLQVVLRDRKLSAQSSTNKMFHGNVRVSVESYVQHNMYSIIMKGLISRLTDEIGSFNKTLRSLSAVQLTDLTALDTAACNIPKARTELSHIDEYSTVLGKLSCFKRCINNLSNGQLSIDELLPVLVFLVAKSGVQVWVAQLRYVQEFNFSRDENHADELSFLATTLEAVLTYVKSGLFFAQKHYGDIGYVCGKSRLFWKTKNHRLHELFREVVENDVRGVQEVLERYHKPPPTTHPYCHPLCSCDHCEQLQAAVTDEGVAVDTATEHGCTATHVAACYGKSATLDWLLNAGANPNATDFAGSTPLHCASAHGHQNAVLLLMYANSSLEARDDDGNTPLHLAAGNGHMDCIKAILYYAEHAGIRFDVNCPNKDGDTALHVAVKFYYKPIVEILLSYNANPMLKNKHNGTPFNLTESAIMTAVLNNDYNIVNLLEMPVRPLPLPGIESRPSREEYGVRPQTADGLRNAEKLLKYVKEDDLSSVKRYLGFSDYVPATSRRTTKCHPLCQCERCADEDSTDDYDKVDSVSANVCDAVGRTALHLAAEHGRPEMVQFLLDVGAKVNARTYGELRTPLHVACVRNRPAVAKVLLESAACKIDCVDRAGNTALHLACATGDCKLVELLLKYEPDLEVRNERGKTALKMAEDGLAFTVIRLLKKYKSGVKDELLV